MNTLPNFHDFHAKIHNIFLAWFYLSISQISQSQSRVIRRLRLAYFCCCCCSYLVITLTRITINFSIRSIEVSEIEMVKVIWLFCFPQKFSIRKKYANLDNSYINMGIIPVTILHSKELKTKILFLAPRLLPGFVSRFFQVRGYKVNTSLTIFYSKCKMCDDSFRPKIKPLFKDPTNPWIMQIIVINFVVQFDERKCNSELLEQL